ncbi:MAG: hypothetical protein HWD62_15645 [Cyclobacteriaceae bacterium]|nr:MAG: hypothetical protein HWD62_15645 [Cyclobacteriaceae bacterium]
MQNFRRNLILTFGLTLLVTGAFAQTANSPFSFRGLGDYYGNALTHNQGMAGVGVSNPQYFYLNNQNPALLVFNRFTVFEGGFVGQYNTIKGNGASENSGNGNLNYLMMGFPVKMGKWSTSVGLAPFSGVNYRTNYTEDIEGGTGTVDVEEKGRGGINQVFWANGVALSKSLSVGVRATYLFSSIVNEYTNSITQTANPVIYSPTIYERTYVKDFNFSVGTSFHKDSLFNKNYRFNIGAVYNFKSELNTEYYTRIERRNSSGGITDSTTLINNNPGTITLPQSFTVGVSFGRAEKWMIGADYSYLKNSLFRDYFGNSQNGTDSWRMALGGEFTPDPMALSGYLKRMTYRTGVSLEQYPYLINGKPVNDFGINFGFTMPVSRISSLDFALKVGKRGTMLDHNIEENYFKVYFGVTINDQFWFIKRRFD